MRYAHTGRYGSKMIDDPDLRKLWEPGKAPAWPNDRMQEYRRRIADAIVALEPSGKGKREIVKLKDGMQKARKAGKPDEVKRLADQIIEHPEATGEDRGLARYRLVDATIAAGADWDEIAKAGEALVNEDGAVPGHVMVGCTSIGQMCNSKKNYKEAAKWLGKAKEVLAANDLWGSASVVCRDLSASQWLSGKRREAAETVLEALEGMENAERPLTFYFQSVYLSRRDGFGEDGDRKLRGQGLALKLAARTKNVKDISDTFDFVRKQNAYGDKGVFRATKRLFIDCLDVLAAAAKKAGGAEGAATLQRIAAYRAGLSSPG